MKRKADSPITVRPSTKPRLSISNQDIALENEMIKDKEDIDTFKLNFIEKLKHDASPSKKVSGRVTKDCFIRIAKLKVHTDETIKTHQEKDELPVNKVVRSLGGVCGTGAKLRHLLDEKDLEAEDPVYAFLLYAHERQNIWEMRRDPQCLKSKLTQNEIMEKNFFTNNYRELDKGTVYFRNQLFTTDLKERGFSRELDEDILKKVFYKATVYRLLNRRSTFIEFGGIPSVELEEWQKFNTFLYEKRDNKKAIFTSAHQSMGLERYINSIEHLRANLGDLTRSILRAAEDRSLARCFQTLTSIPNVGDFLAWQILCDLLEAHTLGRCNENQWTKLGPGAKDGIKRIFGNVRSKTDLEYARLLRDICTLKGEHSGFEALGIEFPAPFGDALSLKNIEHTLCEFSKYWKLAIEDKPSGRKYAGASHPDLLRCVLCDVKMESGAHGENGNYRENETVNVVNNEVNVEDIKVENSVSKTEVVNVSEENNNSSAVKTIKRLCHVCEIYENNREMDYDYEEDENCPEYEVESVIDHKIVKGDSEYLIKWKGFGHKFNTWEPSANLSCDDIIDRYKAQVKR